MDMNKFLSPLKTIVLLRVGVAVFAAGVVMAALPMVLDSKKPLPELTPMEQEMFMMMDLEPKLALKYKKYGDVVAREEVDSLSRPGERITTTTYFYIANAKGGMNPIGDRRDRYEGEKLVARHWRTIKGTGETSGGGKAYWKGYYDVIGYGPVPATLGGGFDINNAQLGGLTDKTNMRIRMRDGAFDATDSVRIATIARAGAAMRNADAVSVDVARAVKAAAKEDQNAQGACSNDFFIYQPSSKNDGSHEFTSVLGGTSALDVYGFEGMQGLHTFVVDASQRVAEVVAVPLREGGYDIDDIRRCSTIN